MQPLHLSLLSQLSVPLAIAAGVLQWSPTTTFVLVSTANDESPATHFCAYHIADAQHCTAAQNFLALIPLALILGDVTEGE